MKRYITLLLVAISCFLCCFSACGKSNSTESNTPVESSTVSEPTESESESQKVPVTATARVMSINIAGQDMTNSENVGTVKYPGQNGHDYTYEKRRERLDALITEFEPDVLLLQEVNGQNWWWPYLVSNDDSFINTFTNYTLIGRTNRIGESDGEGNNWFDLYNQLYYDHNKFEEVASGMFYLNVKRNVPFSREWHESASYSSDDNNTCVWAVLKDKKTGVSAVYASTHLKPTGGFLARTLTNYRQAINLADGLYKIAEQYSDEGGVLPIAVGGDFNLVINHKYNYSYPHLTEIANFSDAKKIATKTDNSGTARVWGKSTNQASSDGSSTDGTRIDIFFTQGMSVSKYQCLNGTFLEDINGVYYTSERIFDGSAYDLSDHLPIMMDVKISSDDREVLPQGECYRNNVADSDTIIDGGESVVQNGRIVFSGADILNYFSESQYLKADIIEINTGKALRLIATEACPNLFIKFDLDGLLRDKGLTASQIDNVKKIKISYKTAFTVEESEFAVAILNDGETTVKHGQNTCKLTNSNGFVEKTIEINYSDSASGLITDIVFGTMAYADDYSGVCGLFAGDCIYVKSIEFLA